MWPHLTTAGLVICVGLRAAWMAPDWGVKVVDLAHEIRRYRESSASGGEEQGPSAPADSFSPYARHAAR